MLTTPIVFTATTPERYDRNQVELTGLITKIWARSTGDVFARIAIGVVSDEEDINPKPEAIDARLTLQLPNGQVNGEDISLLKGDVVKITGYLSDITQWETLRDFLLKVRQISLIERISELAPAIDARVKHMLTCVVPETLEVLPVRSARYILQSSACLEGVVAKLWEFGGHLFARLAVYDHYTQITDMPGNNGRTRRIPHYVTVQFTNEQVDGRVVNLKRQDRMRVSGALGSRIYSENLRTFLLSAHKADVLANLSDGQAPDEVWTAYVQTCLIAQKMIQYTKR
jgi:hypothetical protein